MQYLMAVGDLVRDVGGNEAPHETPAVMPARMNKMDCTALDILAKGTPILLAHNNKPGDARVALWEVGGNRVVSTTGNSIWEDGPAEEWHYGYRAAYGEKRWTYESYWDEVIGPDFIDGFDASTTRASIDKAIGHAEEAANSMRPVDLDDRFPLEWIEYHARALDWALAELAK
jgi:hypothetical protein